MEQIRTAHEATIQQANDVALESSRGSKDLQLLSDLEMVLVGGGDTIVPWP